MRQQTLADEGFERYRKPTRREQFLNEMDKIIPWDAGADILHCGDSLASCDVISPRTFERLSYPYLKKVFQVILPCWKPYYEVL